MAEKKFDAQVNYGWGLSLNMTGKAPAVAKRIFNKLADAQTYANDVNDSAIEGLVLSVVADDADKNGVYFVQSIKTGAEAAAAVLVKLGSADAATGGASDALNEAKKYTDAEVKKLADDAVKTNTDAITVLNGGAETEGSVAKAVADEKALREAADQAITSKIGTVDDGKTVMGTIAEEVKNRQTAISNLKGTLGDDDAKTLEAINDELDAIDAKIGVVPTGKTVVGMIAAAESAAKAAATKMELATSEAFLTLEHTTDEDGAITYAIGTKDLASDAELQDEIDRALAAEASLQAKIGKAATEEGGPTGLHKEIADVNATIDAMDSTKTGEGTFVDVTVKQLNGVITEVTVAESDIASANALTAETKAREDADNDITDRLDVIEGSGEGSIKKALKDAKDYTDAEIAEEVTARTNAIASAKTDLIGSATTEYNTLGKLEGKIKDAEAAAKAAATKLNKASDASHLTLTSLTSTSGEITYTIGESDIASKTALDNEVTARTTDDNAIKGRLNVLEGVTVKGKDAIVVSASGATESKVVSLKLGAQPSKGVAGVVLSQNADGLVAKLQWGTF